MSNGPFRVPIGHDAGTVARLIDHSRRLSFTFDGQRHEGFAGDTLASALLANGVRLVGRSFKYHRPRGVLCAGSEEPNALVAVGTGARLSPNQRATTVELFDGLVARSQNRWPSLAWDIGQLNGLAARFLPAGFYYKTFMWPASAWPLYERLIRRFAGLGPAPRAADPDIYEHIHVTCDVLIAGGGVAGLAAASAAAEAGARVILADEAPRLGGISDLFEATIDGAGALDWAGAKTADLASRENVHLLNRTTVAGLYDHNFVLLSERLTDHDPVAGANLGRPRERLWKVRAREIIVATGAHERPLTFANNDRPGVILGSAARAYISRYGVSPGQTGIVFTNNDDGYRTASDLNRVGIAVSRVVDIRTEPDGRLVDAMRKADIAISAGHVVANVETTVGGSSIKAVQIAARRDSGRIGTLERVACDFVCQSGGWNPSAQLAAHTGAKLVWDDEISSLRPATAPAHLRVVGGANGTFALMNCLEEGYAAGDGAARAALGAPKRRSQAPTKETVSAPTEGGLEPLWFSPSYGALNEGTKHFLDQQNDVTAADVELAVREGYASAEHLKRYTTLGMATDQGKTGNINALAIHAEAAGAAIAEIGATTFRPPYTPVTFGAIAGRQAKDLFHPLRRSPVWHWHANHDANLEPVGHWRRPLWYGAGALGRPSAIEREILAVRNAVGVLDASTLGKIEVVGPDAGRFLDLIYTNSISTLEQGQCRYGLMLNEQGFVFDDGIVARIGADRFLAHTTSGSAGHVLAWLERWLQTEWPDFKVFVGAVTEQWAQFALAGPKARIVLAALDGDIDFGAKSFPFLTWRAGTLEGTNVRIFRVSYTGELSYEIACPSNQANALWERLIDAGRAHDIVAYGTEALHVMRAEKGFIAIGDETDGTVTPDDLGLSWAVADTKADFIGKRGLQRQDLVRPDRRQLVGILTEDPEVVLSDGAYAIEQSDRDTEPPHQMIGHVTSSYASPTLGRSIALALVERGRDRHGETIVFPTGRTKTSAEIVEPTFYDKSGERQNV